jgi:Tol biopolymer transport system component
MHLHRWYPSFHGSLVLVLMITFLLPSVATLAQSAGVDHEHFQRVWDRTDLPVAEGIVDRTWMWGPAVSGALYERYDDSPGQQRLVQYFDKSRMEINNPDAADDGLWYVTNGLLAVELITGRVQVAGHIYETALPSELNVAGDQGFPNGPSYATFRRFVDLPDYLQTPDNRGDAVVIERIDRAGIETRDQNLAAQNVRLAFYDEVTFHNIAAPFWEFMHSSGLVYENDAYITSGLFANPFYATGRPVTEPYWADVVVAGTEKLVLIQCFERRCLTWTPDNPEGWQVEAGNVGQHYYHWRHAGPPALEGQLIYLHHSEGAGNGSPTADVYLVNVDGSGARNLTGNIDAMVQHAEWAPDGIHIALVAGGNLYVMDADGGDVRQLTESGADASPAWSPDGFRIAFQRQLGPYESQIFVIDVDGAGERQLTHIPPFDPPGADTRVSYSRQPVWSPDGSRIAFSRENTRLPLARGSEIHVIDTDGQNLRQIASGSFFTSPAWSPDGAWIMFSRPQMAGREVWGSGLHLVAADDPEPEPVTLAGYDSSNPYDAVWSPGGDLIALSLTPVLDDDLMRRWGTRGLHLLDPLTGERTQITHTGMQPAWSPDGQYLAFVIDPLTAGIAVTDRSGLVQWIVSGDGYHPRWRPGGGG